MTEEIRFVKMHGAGNDYIYVNTLSEKLSESPEELAVKWSKLHTGIGSDGLVLIGHSDKADFSMRIFNADGSEAMMCGNASRCIGKYVYDEGLIGKTTVTLETLSGIRELKLEIDNKVVKEVTVDMGKPEVGEVFLTLKAAGEEFTGTSISMGNPHLVIFVDDITKINLPKVGPELENNPLFPARTNVEFVQVINSEKVRMRVWERGSGITQACGTGACATAVAGVVTGRTGRNVTVLMDGGPLTIFWDDASERVFMTGEAVRVFEGKIEIGGKEEEVREIRS